MITMRIPTSNEFWLWLTRFAYKRLDHKPTPMPVGIPTVRDPDNPCGAFAPRSLISNDWGDCETDGHYLCAECAHRQHPDSDDL